MEKEIKKRNNTQSTDMEVEEEEKNNIQDIKNAFLLTSTNTAVETAQVQLVTMILKPSAMSLK